MKEFREAIQRKFDLMQQSGKLFRVELTGSTIWDLYLESMGKTIFRDPSASEWDCKNCCNWARRYSNIVSINSNYEIETMFDVDLHSDSEYFNTTKVLNDTIKKSKIVNVFFETYQELNSLNYEKCSKTNSVFQLGVPQNFKKYTLEEAQKFGVVNINDIYTFNHFALKVNKDFVDQSGKSVEALMGDYRSAYDVFKRGIQGDANSVPITVDTLELVRDLINQGSLLNGTTYLPKIETMIKFTKEFNKLSKSERDNWFWVTSYKLPFAKFRNELIGTLCVELSEGLDLNTACKNWNKREDPTNKCKPTAPITQKQINEAKQFVIDNSYESAFNRRMATMRDIKVNEILHSNVGNGEIQKISMFDNIKSTSTRHKRNEFDGVEVVGIEKFMKDILPTCTSVEAFLTANLESNLCSLTTAAEDSKQIFKYGNIFSKTFNGNIAGVSQIKEAIESRGGKTQGCLNIRLAFPKTTSDYDLWVVEPNGHKICYGNRRSVQSSSGMLDLDAQGADGSFPPDKRVENAIYTDSNKMPIGDYQVLINNYRNVNDGFGFDLEVEIEGDVNTFNYNKKIENKETIKACIINWNGKVFTVKPVIPITNSNFISKEIYGLETNQFHKVNLVCLSPNHWGNSQEGHKYYMFMLESCKSPTSIRGFHNEDLIPSLYDHRRVLEVLGTVQMVESTEGQLSGLGFNSTIKSEIILKLKGSFNRVIKVIF